MLAPSSTSVATDSARLPGTAGTTRPGHEGVRSPAHLPGRATAPEPDYSADGDNASDVSNPYLYTGRRNDAETNLLQYRNRYYETHLGRFISRDPAGYVDGYNLYEYASGRVVKMGDAFGQMGPITGFFVGQFIECAVGHLQGILAAAAFETWQDITNCREAQYHAAYNGDIPCCNCGGRRPRFIPPKNCKRYRKKDLAVNWEDKNALASFFKCLVGANNPVPVKVDLDLWIEYHCYKEEGDCACSLHINTYAVARRTDGVRGFAQTDKRIESLSGKCEGRIEDMEDFVCERCD